MEDLIEVTSVHFKTLEQILAFGDDHMPEFADFQVLLYSHINGFDGIKPSYTLKLAADALKEHCRFLTIDIRGLEIDISGNTEMALKYKSVCVPGALHLIKGKRGFDDPKPIGYLVRPHTEVKRVVEHIKRYLGMEVDPNPNEEDPNEEAED